MRKLRKVEKETIITYNEADEYAEVFTYNRKLQNKLQGKLNAELILDNGYGGKTFIVPKKWIRVSSYGKREGRGGL